MKAQTESDIARLDSRIRNGIVLWEEAAHMIADKARSVRLDAWQLQFDPIYYSALKAIGIYRPIDINYRYLHVFATLLDGDQRPILALHTMPISEADPTCPGTIGIRGAKIRVFALTPDASDARFQRDNHRCLGVTETRRLSHPAQRAQLVIKFADAVAAQNNDYTVPVATVRDEIESTLRDQAPLQDRSALGRALVVSRRKIGGRLMRCDNSVLAQRLNRFCAFNLGANGFNSNTGAGDLARLLGYGMHGYTAANAPFIQSSMLDTMPELKIDLGHVDEMPELPTKPASAPLPPRRMMASLFRRFWARQPQVAAA